LFTKLRCIDLMYLYMILLLMVVDDCITLLVRVV